MKVSDQHGEYLKRQESFERYGRMLLEHLEGLLRARNITLGTPLEFRVKTWASASRKLDQVLSTGTPLISVEDLIGIRVILLFRRQVDAVCDLLNHNFQVLKRKNVGENANAGEFGYSSAHCVIQMPAYWLTESDAPDPPDGLKVEIQVRSLAQHTWAAASHLLQYKEPGVVPFELRRAFGRVAALLETVDLEFERALDARDTYRSDLGIQPEAATLDVDLIEKVLDEVLPKTNKDNVTEDYARLQAELLNFGVSNPHLLRRLMSEHLQAILRRDKEEVKRLRGFDEILFGRSELERLNEGVWFDHVGLARLALREHFGEEYVSYRKRMKAELKEQESSLL